MVEAFYANNMESAIEAVSRNPGSLFDSNLITSLGEKDKPLTDREAVF